MRWPRSGKCVMAPVPLWLLLRPWACLYLSCALLVTGWLACRPAQGNQHPNRVQSCGAWQTIMHSRIVDDRATRSKICRVAYICSSSLLKLPRTYGRRRRRREGELLSGHYIWHPFAAGRRFRSWQWRASPALFAASWSQQVPVSSPALLCSQVLAHTTWFHISCSSLHWYVRTYVRNSCICRWRSSSSVPRPEDRRREPSRESPVLLQRSLRECVHMCIYTYSSRLAYRSFGLSLRQLRAIWCQDLQRVPGRAPAGPRGRAGRAAGVGGRLLRRAVPGGDAPRAALRRRRHHGRLPLLQRRLRRRRPPRARPRLRALGPPGRLRRAAAPRRRRALVRPRERRPRQQPAGASDAAAAECGRCRRPRMDVSAYVEVTVCSGDHI